MTLQPLHQLGKIALAMAVETERVEIWHDLMDRYARTMSALERRLESEHGLGVSEYEVLERLA